MKELTRYEVMQIGGMIESAVVGILWSAAG